MVRAAPGLPPARRSSPAPPARLLAPLSPPPPRSPPLSPPPRSPPPFSPSAINHSVSFTITGNKQFVNSTSEETRVASWLASDSAFNVDLHSVEATIIDHNQTTGSFVLHVIVSPSETATHDTLVEKFNQLQSANFSTNLEDFWGATDVAVSSLDTVWSPPPASPPSSDDKTWLWVTIAIMAVGLAIMAVGFADVAKTKEPNKGERQTLIVTSAAPIPSISAHPHSKASAHAEKLAQVFEVAASKSNARARGPSGSLPAITIK